jgi:branched-subunit amino acid transport protein
VTWFAVLGTAVGCYALKLAGWSLPARWVEHERVRRAAALLPLALLAALVVVQAFGDGRSLAVDARAAGLLAGGVAALRRASFIVIVVVAAATAAGLRALSAYIGQ